jgi:LacI family transcriptional regulator
MTKPTLKEVAERAGVHPSTVSRALNPNMKGRVTAATVRRVSAAARSLGYQPNSIARSLRTSRTLTVGMLVPDIMNPLFPPTVRGAEDVLTGDSYTVLLANTDNSRERQALHLDALRSRQVDGFILATARVDDPQIDEVIDSGTPTVLVHEVVDRSALHAVVADNAGGIRAAVTHLVQLGHRRIAHLAGPQSRSPAVARLRGFRQALMEHDLEHAAGRVVLCDSWTEADGAAGFQALLDSDADFTAVVAASDLLALGCLGVARERGLGLPRDVSLVGFHDMSFVDKLEPALTTVRVPHYEMGAEAARMLLDQLHRDDVVAKIVTLPVELIVRGSTAPPRSD